MPGPVPETMYVSYSLAGGGAERLLTNILLQQRVPGHVRVVTLRSGGVFQAVLEEAGVEVVDLGMKRYRDAFAGVFRLARLIRVHRPEVVHGWDYFTNLLLFPARFLARSRARIFWGAFGTNFGPRKLTLPFRVVVWLNVLLSSRVDGVAYNGAEVRDHHRALGFREPRSAVISNSIDAEVFRHDAEQRAALREELGLAPNEVVVAVVARVDPQKDWPTVCEAVRGLRGVVTVAAGIGTTALPAQPGLIALGWRDDVVNVLSAADIFLLVSAFGEGISLAIGEAMLCGLPCIVTDVGGNGRLVGDAGIVVKPGDAASIREAIVALARDPERRRLLGQRARARAAEITSRDGAIQRLHALDLAEAPS
ncbi:MAG TPA: glycosyltransferase [Thermoanaerobaculia bacterium]|jgi:glycosyltransferase involved in cell wall biosynthesis|nr:glycosyltransferase [Thermoanaerobaculia bacterium]